MKKLLIGAAIILCAGIVPLTCTAVTANADTVNVPEVTAQAAGGDTAQPYILTRISVVTRADSEYVYGVAKNTFTLFISTVPVHIYLYSCDFATSDLSQMTLEAEASTGDLNVNKEITCKALHTEQKYWVAYCVYKTDNVTKTGTSTPVLYSVDGKN